MKLHLLTFSLDSSYYFVAYDTCIFSTKSGNLDLMSTADSPNPGFSLWILRLRIRVIMINNTDVLPFCFSLSPCFASCSS